MEYFGPQHNQIDKEKLEREASEQPNTLVAQQMAARQEQAKKEKERKRLLKPRRLSGHVSLSEKMVLLDNMATMLKAGLPLAATLNTLGEEMKNKYLKSVLAELKRQVENGELLSTGMKHYPKVFPEILVATIEVGESSGLLAEVLGHLALMLKSEKELRSKVISALMYPSVVLIALIGVSLLLALMVFPKLIEIFIDAGVALPPVLVIVQTIVYILTNYYYLVIGVVVLIVVLLPMIFRLPKPRAWLHWRLLYLPLAGPLIREINLTRFSGNLRVLLTAGLPIIKSLETVARTLGNLSFRSTVITMADEMGKGVALHASLAQRPHLFPSLMVQLCKVGEETGELDNILTKISDYYNTRVNNVLTNLSTIIEPVLLIVVGVAVGFIAVSVIGPIYELTNSFGDS